MIETLHCVGNSVHWRPYKTPCRHQIKIKLWNSVAICWAYRDSGNTLAAFAMKKTYPNYTVWLCKKPQSCDALLWCHWGMKAATCSTIIPMSSRPTPLGWIRNDSLP
jgi:hypothetical protein